MGMKDRRKPLENISIERELIEEGTAQLTSEIKVLELWLREVESADEDDSEAVAARKSYNDMLRSRKEMLCALESQTGFQIATSDN